ADDLEDSDLRAGPDADARMNDPRIAARAVRELRSDFAEELLRHGGGQYVGSRLAPRLQRVAFAERDDLLRHWPRRFRARQRGGNPSVLEQVRDEIPQRRAPMRRIASKF